ncbi:conidial pigment biosynthesis oxidase Abr1/brown 1 [Aspergillus luchuensis]|uniref:Conidial pigment biosynthesis oxidase Abr1/brown 1 n=1 Tax=Aspergillus kawachii TaxID=1069201 RepID=A0A146FGB1_ASPKA|nr:conidial pigment biosynthesis oxidase Abr1/brown 1 [Aspergillus luchuensis]
MLHSQSARIPPPPMVHSIKALGKPPYVGSVTGTLI